MKRFFFYVLCACATVLPVHAIENKTTATVGVTPLSKAEDQDAQFGGAYLLLDSVLGTEYVTVGGKVYYRLSTADSWDALSQKLDVKKAYLKFRPFGSDVFELAMGRLYSYYLPGSFFSLTETYTGASRWGKTGVGMKASWQGLVGGVGIPLTESMASFDDERSIAGGLSYDVATLSTSVPLAFGAAFLYEEEKEVDKKTKKESRSHETAITLSAYYTPKLNGFVHGFSLFMAYSHNAEPYVASSVFKPVVTYKQVGRAQFVSFSLKVSLGSVQIVGEGEFGKSMDADLLPLYTGVQLLVPLTEHLSFKPRFFYYAAINTEQDEQSRDAYEFYPRLWYTRGRLAASAGIDIVNMQTARDDYTWSWSMPLYVEMKVGR